VWINGGCWDDEPPPGSAVVLDEAGNVVGYEQPQHQRERDRGIAEIGEEMAHEIERRGGRW
jgi:hypothetical protein